MQKYPNRNGIVKAASKAAHMGNRTEMEGPGERGCVLLVDDEESLRHALSKTLQRKGYEVLEASNGACALEVLRARDVDVVVSDIRMPDMDGIALLQVVRERTPDVPFLLLTGTPDVATAVKAVGYGAFEYLTKPGDLPRLGESVGKALEAHRLATTRRRLLDSASGRGRNAEPRRSLDQPVGPGTLLDGRYRLGRLIGAGGMGTVYEAQREDLAGMIVAVKVLHSKLTARPDLLRRFRREAEVVATLHHPNIVKVIDFVARPDEPEFLVMELLRGTTLATAIENDPPFSERRVAFIASQVLGALAVAHSVQVIHRDLKPDNLLLTTVAGIEDVVKLVDFGIAKLLAPPDGQRLTETGLVLGTPAYMAPEYARGEPASASGDLYALGCVMYEALTRRQPFSGANYNAILFAIQDEAPRPIQTFRPDVSPEFSSIVDRALAKDPKARFPSAQAMAEDLRAWLACDTTTERPMLAGLGTAPTIESPVPRRKAST